MAEKRPKVAKDEPDARKGFYFAFWMNTELANDFNTYLESTDPRASRTSALRKAVREMLARQGFKKYEKE
jgi:hypothetical protein